MDRVVAIRSSRILTIERNGIPRDITLGQVVVPPRDEAAAIAWMTRTLRAVWVLVETAPDGLSYVYRSPDALFVNGELARHAYASATPMMTYLGESAPQAEPRVTAKATAKQKAVPARRKK